MLEVGECGTAFLLETQALYIMLVNMKMILLSSLSVLLLITWKVVVCLLFCWNILIHTADYISMTSVYVFPKFLCVVPPKKWRPLFKAEWKYMSVCVHFILNLYVCVQFEYSRTCSKTATTSPSEILRSLLKQAMRNFVRKKFMRICSAHVAWMYCICLKAVS